jgi:Bacteriophage tail sheath protein
MPVLPTYPGVYIEELPSGVRTITPVATSITAFIGRALRGPVDEPTLIHSFGDFERVYGGLWGMSPMTYAVQQFYLNGGSEAVIVRVHHGAGSQTFTLPTGGPPLLLEAASPGAWANDLGIAVDHVTAVLTDPNQFNLYVLQKDKDTNRTGILEPFRNLSSDPTSSRFVATVLKQESRLVRVQSAAPAQRPNSAPLPADPTQPMPIVAGPAVDDGGALITADVLGSQAAKTGIYQLEKTDLFNLLCLPPLNPSGLGTTDPPPTGLLDLALAYCKERRAMLIIDSPEGWKTKDDVLAAGTGIAALEGAALRDPNAAVFFPRLRIPDPLQENRTADFVPCGAVCGIIARTDAQRGVWKAPAGLDAQVAGLKELTYRLTDPEQGDLNPLAVNCLRTFPVTGTVVWGSRTFRGADRLASEWKYLSVRRVTLFIEESLYRGTQWVVFEPNDEPLWAQIRLNVGAFMHGLYRQGAFQGSTPRDAYLVKCDQETTQQADIDRGIVNILVAFAPLKPAEFVILKIQQKARLPET